MCIRDRDYTVDVSASAGLVISYETTFTADRTITLPVTTDPSDLEDLQYITVSRSASGAFNLIVDAGTFTINGTSVVGVTPTILPGTSTISTNAATGSVALYRVTNGNWQVINIANNFA